MVSNADEVRNIMSDWVVSAAAFFEKSRLVLRRTNNTQDRSPIKHNKLASNRVPRPQSYTILARDSPPGINGLPSIDGSIVVLRMRGPCHL
jgi:hypothetical protein